MEKICYSCCVIYDTNTIRKEVLNLNAHKLLGKIKERGLTIAEAAQKSGMSLSSLRRKMSGDSQFTREEIDRICITLELSNDDLLAVFFSS